MPTPAEARDTVLGIAHAAWTAGGAPTASLPLLYGDVKGDKPGEGAATTQALGYGRFTVNIVESPQTTQGKRRRYMTQGLFTAQVFAPFGDGRQNVDAYAKILTDAFRAHTGTAAGVHFFDIVPLDLGEEGPHSRTDVQASFRFQEAA